MRPQWALMSLLVEAAKYLAGKGVQTPRLDAEVLLAHVLGCGRLDLYLRHDQPIDPRELDGFREAIRRRSQREPVAYITGTKEFWSLPIGVSRDVLIPRPETELLVEGAIQIVRASMARTAGPLRILEVGTGSGAVALALAHELGEGVELLATDRYPEALQVAHSNARKLGLDGRVGFLEGDLFEPLGGDERRFFMILSNPPYIPTREISKLPPEIRTYEPVQALDGGWDGLCLIRRLVEESPVWLEADGYLLLESGEGQAAAVESILKGTARWSSWEWKKDLAGVDRVICAAMGSSR